MSFFVTREQAKIIDRGHQIEAENEQRASAWKAQQDFAEDAGYTFGLKKLPVDLDAFGAAFKRRFPNGNAADWECTFIRSHQIGTERREYALANGATRPPEVPSNMLATLEGCGLKY